MYLLPQLCSLLIPFDCGNDHKNAVQNNTNGSDDLAGKLHQFECLGGLFAQVDATQKALECAQSQFQQSSSFGAILETILDSLAVNGRGLGLNLPPVRWTNARTR